jgi:hypothetical protein
MALKNKTSTWKSTGNFIYQYSYIEDVSHGTIYDGALGGAKTPVFATEGHQRLMAAIFT